jgi:glycosyltransferase involved in cell wall biosynthesis
MRVTAFTKYDREAASTRQRFLQYGPSLARAGIELRHLPLLGDDYVRSLATREHWSKAALICSYANRIVELFRVPSTDLIWIHAELLPYLPFVFDKLVFRSGAPIVYDCDDAVFVKYNENRHALVRLLFSGKVEKLISGADAATCGNEYLRDLAARYCSRSVIFPTVVDTDVYVPQPASRKSLVIGWIGSPTSWHNVRPILPLLCDFCRQTNTRFRVVGAGFEGERDRFPEMELVDWTEDREVAEVQGFDVGIMPLVDGPFERGKSGYKLIQYMACGVPAVASRVGANKSVLTDATGLFADTEAEWSAALRRLLGDESLRRRLGEGGRARALAHYSLEVHAPRLIALFKELAELSVGMPSFGGDRRAY